MPQQPQAEKQALLLLGGALSLQQWGAQNGQGATERPLLPAVLAITGRKNSNPKGRRGVVVPQDQYILKSINAYGEHPGIDHNRDRTSSSSQILWQVPTQFSSITRGRKATQGGGVLHFTFRKKRSSANLRTSSTRRRRNEMKRMKQNPKGYSSVRDQGDEEELQPVKPSQHPMFLPFPRTSATHKPADSHYTSIFVIIIGVLFLTVALTRWMASYQARDATKLDEENPPHRAKPGKKPRTDRRKKR